MLITFVIFIPNIPPKFNKMSFQSLLIMFCMFEVSLSNSLLTCKNLHTHKNFHLLPTKTKCGKAMPEFRIMGGKNADLGQYPWMAVLLKKDTSQEKKLQLFCGGSIINKKYVLTAAHCVSWNYKVEDIVVHLGEYDMSKVLDCKDGKCAAPLQERKVEQIIKHNKYDHRTRRDFDIALVRVHGQINFNEFVQAICLPTTCATMENLFHDVTLTTCGWGMNMDLPKVRRTDVLQKVHLKSVAMNVCKKNWPQQQISLKHQLCAGGSSVGVMGKDSCEGDSGGPLMYLNNREGFPFHFVLVGIVSEGQECEKTDFQPAGIYTRVGAFMDWILDHIRE